MEADADVGDVDEYVNAEWRGVEMFVRYVGCFASAKEPRLHREAIHEGSD